MQEIHRDVGIVKTVIIHDLKILVYTYLPLRINSGRWITSFCATRLAILVFLRKGKGGWIYLEVVTVV